MFLYETADHANSYSCEITASCYVSGTADSNRKDIDVTGDFDPDVGSETVAFDVNRTGSDLILKLNPSVASTYRVIRKTISAN